MLISQRKQHFVGFTHFTPAALSGYMAANLVSSSTYSLRNLLTFFVCGKCNYIRIMSDMALDNQLF